MPRHNINFWAKQCLLTFGRLCWYRFL
jgi:hypothetical protein